MFFSQNNCFRICVHPSASTCIVRRDAKSRDTRKKPVFRKHFTISHNSYRVSHTSCFQNLNTSPRVAREKKNLEQN